MPPKYEGVWNSQGQKPFTATILFLLDFCKKGHVTETLSNLLLNESLSFHTNDALTLLDSVLFPYENIYSVLLRFDFCFEETDWK